MRASKPVIVIESFAGLDRAMVERWAASSRRVCVIEPFLAHHKTGERHPWLSATHPDWAEKMIADKQLQLIPISALGERTLYARTAERAVASIDEVYPEYRREHAALIDSVRDALVAPEAEHAFKKLLCERLAVFFSQNLILERLHEHLGAGPILFYPDMSTACYHDLEEIVDRSGCRRFAHPDILFPPELEKRDRRREDLAALKMLLALCAQTAASGLLGWLTPCRRERREFPYGATLASARQLANPRRGPAFFIDGKRIKSRDVAVIPAFNLSAAQRRELERLGGPVVYPPRSGRFFSDFAKWLKLLIAARRGRWTREAAEIRAACVTLFHFTSWTALLKHVSLRHFITHCDFGLHHVGRNIALKQAGVQTWYFSDSMSHGYVGQAEGESTRVPFWTYLLYDHFVTWCAACAAYFNTHPGTAMEAHVVGCLWAGPQKKPPAAGRPLRIAVFDTSYARKGNGTYSEGIAFARDILRLAEEMPDTVIDFKEKKPRSTHAQYEPVLGPELVELYQQMDDHPRFRTLPHEADTSDVIAAADIVVSFPFTSTTYEAFCINKPALWHDVLGLYRDSAYRVIPGAVSHSFAELLAAAARAKNGKDAAVNPFPAESPLMDPFRDGRAVERFRELLTKRD
ncbi:MAG: polysaccharide biosynthesis PFTS motif protein [Elusimicrobiota bacterium]